MYVLYCYVCFISGNPHLKAVRSFQLSASGGVVPQDYMNSTWDAAVQKTLGAEEMGYVKFVFVGRGYLPFKIWMGCICHINSPLYGIPYAPK